MMQLKCYLCIVSRYGNGSDGKETGKYQVIFHILKILKNAQNSE